jgi:hypothetical protein
MMQRNVRLRQEFDGQPPLYRQSPCQRAFMPEVTARHYIGVDGDSESDLAATATRLCGLLNRRRPWHRLGYQLT